MSPVSTTICTMSEPVREPERIGVVAIAAALGKNRKIVQRWKERGAGTLFDAEGRAVLAEVIEWARRTGHLDRVRGRPDDFQRLLAAVDSSGSAAAQASVEASAPAPSRPLAGEPSGPITAEEREALETLASGDRGKLLDLATRIKPELLKRLAAMGRTRRELAEAERRELENKQKRRQLVEIEHVRRFWGGQIAIVTGHFHAVPGKLAKLLEGKPYDEIYRVLEDELHALLKRFAVEVPT